MSSHGRLSGRIFGNSAPVPRSLRHHTKTSLTLFALALLILSVGEVPRVAVSQNYVGQLVADIASLPSAQGDSCQAVISAVQGGGVVEQDLNRYLGTDFKPVSVNNTECSLLVSFVPIVSSYNGLIIAAQQYDPNNATSVRNFYEKAFLLAAEVFIVGIALDGVLYKASFETTAELNNGLKLGKLQSICGDQCYSDVLSSLYWFIKGSASQFLTDFISWAGRYLENVIIAAPAVIVVAPPPICSVPVLGWILSLFHLAGCGGP